MNLKHLTLSALLGLSTPAIAQDQFFSNINFSIDSTFSIQYDVKRAYYKIIREVEQHADTVYSKQDIFVYEKGFAIDEDTINVRLLDANKYKYGPDRDEIDFLIAHKNYMIQMMDEHLDGNPNYVLIWDEKSPIEKLLPNYILFAYEEKYPNKQICRQKLADDYDNFQTRMQTHYYQDEDKYKEPLYQDMLRHYVHKIADSLK